MGVSSLLQKTGTWIICRIHSCFRFLVPGGPLCAHPLNVAASEQEGKGKVTIAPRLISESLTCLASVCNFHLASQIFLLNETGKV